MRAMQAIADLKGGNADQDAGINITRHAMREPLKQIVANTGHADPSIVLNAVVNHEGNYGYNAQSEQYGDLAEMGILDPTKVVRSALQNAGSIAGLMITTEAMVADDV